MVVIPWFARIAQNRGPFHSNNSQIYAFREIIRKKVIFRLIFSWRLTATFEIGWNLAHFH